MRKEATEESCHAPHQLVESCRVSRIGRCDLAYLLGRTCSPRMGADGFGFYSEAAFHPAQLHAGAVRLGHGNPPGRDHVRRRGIFRPCLCLSLEVANRSTRKGIASADCGRSGGLRKGAVWTATTQSISVSAQCRNKSQLKMLRVKEPGCGMKN